MGQSGWFRFGVHLYQPTLDFAFFILEWTIAKRIWCYIKKKELQKDIGRPFSYSNVTDKNKMAATKKQCFLRFIYWTESSPTVIQILLTILLFIILITPKWRE